MAIKKIKSNYIEEFKYENFIPEDFAIGTIKDWVIQNENYVHFLISESGCGKWSRWLKNNDKPYPCVCSTREETCFFIELYYELHRIVEFHSKESYFKTAIKEYKWYDGNLLKQLECFSKYKKVASTLFFDTTIRIAYSQEPYQAYLIELNRCEFENTIEFITLFKYD
ncbi:hypothetical protein [Flavobacterium sp. JP2137]|uniref:hypothetical protein n=1 Tax=Flavobacterium sp. JP2137 TaxID=3414510 RepID=UPI003D2FB3C1